MRANIINRIGGKTGAFQRIDNGARRARSPFGRSGNVVSIRRLAVARDLGQNRRPARLGVLQAFKDQYPGSLPGNKVSADCSYWIDNEITVTVPIWDYAGGTGQNAWYHIVGFAGFQITECRGGKDVAGVWRKAFFLGPVGSTPANPLVPQALGIQLVK